MGFSRYSQRRAVGASGPALSAARDTVTVAKTAKRPAIATAVREGFKAKDRWDGTMEDLLRTRFLLITIGPPGGQSADLTPTFLGPIMLIDGQ
jgi:hypothetical protein